MAMPKRKIEKHTNPWEFLPKKKPGDFPKGTEFIDEGAGRFSVFLPNYKERCRENKYPCDPRWLPDAIAFGNIVWDEDKGMHQPEPDTTLKVIERTKRLADLTNKDIAPFTWGRIWFARDVSIRDLRGATLPK